MSIAANTRTTIVPTLHYRHAPEAIAWLCAALGFEEHLVVPDGQGGIAHAQLTFGNGMIMIGSANDSAWGWRMALPADVGGRQTQCSCLTVVDCRRALRAGPCSRRRNHRRARRQGIRRPRLRPARSRRPYLVGRRLRSLGLSAACGFR